MQVRLRRVTNAKEIGERFTTYRMRRLVGGELVETQVLVTEQELLWQRPLVALRLCDARARLRSFIARGNHGE